MQCIFICVSVLFSVHLSHHKKCYLLIAFFNITYLKFKCELAVRYGARLVTERSWVRIPPMAAVYQCQLIMPSLRGQLMSTSEKLGSKQAYRAMH